MTGEAFCLPGLQGSGYRGRRRAGSAERDEGEDGGEDGELHFDGVKNEE